MRVAVVGAGVMGASAAFHLLQGGAEVTLVEAVHVGAGTSGRGAGLVCEGMWHPTSLALVRRSMELLADAGEEGEPWRFHRVGSSTLVPDARVPQVRRLVERQRAWGAEVHLLTPREARDLPRHADVRLDDVAEVVHYPRDGWALPRLYAEGLVQAAAEEGLTRVKAAAGLRRSGKGGERAPVELLAEGEPVQADAIVLATGVHTRKLLQGAGLDAPLAPYRTQAVQFRHPRAHEVPLLHDAAQGFYLRPSWPGQLLAGDGTTTTPEDPDHWRRDADLLFLESTLRRLRHRLPGFAAEGTLGDAWAGLDAATPDRLLLAGKHPDAEGLWLLAGGNGHGFMRAPAAGESLAALVLGKAPPVDLSTFDPGRFRGRLGEAFAIQEGFSVEG